MSPLDFSHAAELDALDPLRDLRCEFHVPVRRDGSPAIYLCGHSLGLQPKAAASIVAQELERWAEDGVEAHFRSERPWVSYHERLAPGLARLAGAQPTEVVAMNSLTVNLHLMLASFYRPQGKRTKILIERRAFPSDRYAVASQLRWHGIDPQSGLIEIGSLDEHGALVTDEICTAIERHAEELALVLLPGVQYLTGQLLDMRTITACAHHQGCLAGFDLAHAIGNVPLHLHAWGADFAVWCSYKYLNAGPGAIGGCFVHARHGEDKRLPRLCGWWGHDKAERFAMPPEFHPISGAEGWQVSNPPILSAAPLLASLELFERAGIDALHRKSQQLSAYMEQLLRATAEDLAEVLTPPAPHRGCQLSIRLRREPREARAVHEQLVASGVICDWRQPDVIRVAPVPLYNTFTDVAAFVEALTAFR